MDGDELKKRMQPSHLTTEDQKEAVQKEAEKVLPEKAEDAVDPEADPKAKREYTFDFKWVDGRGKPWEGKFTNTVLNIRDRQLVGVLRAQLANNVPVEALDPLTQEINLIVAHLTFSLSRKPKWADDLNTLDNPRVLQEVYEEVMAHEATFLGYGPTPEAG